jgi:hypothetical protein
MAMEDMPLHNVCLNKHGSRPTTRQYTRRLVTYHRENTLLTNLKTQPDGSLLNNIQKKVVYATWNMEGITYKEEELHEILQTNNIKKAVIRETKNKLKGTWNTKNYIFMNSGVIQSVRAQSGVMTWIHTSLSKATDHYKYWHDRINEMRCKINRGYLTILGMYAPEGGRHELNDDFGEQLQTIYDVVNKNYCILMLGDVNTQNGNTKMIKIIGTNAESTFNNNETKLTDFCTFNNISIMNSFFKHKDIHKFTWCACGTKSVTDYVIANERTEKVIKECIEGQNVTQTTFYSVQNYSSLQDGKTAKTAINLTEETIIYLR